MKQIKEYITEKLHINNTTKIEYMYHPKNKYELRKILEERLSEDKDANFNDIDISQIDDMGYEGFPDDHGLFENLDPHNIKIDTWDVSNVKDMRGMFYMCDNFNCDLNYWNVSNVEDMYGMFFKCKNFKYDLSNWDVSNVEDMSYMFYECKKFTGEGLEKWKPIKCKDMYDMFNHCNSLKNKPNWYKE